ncbi:hypothetical protein HQ590_16870, partial [bacterium]|nr:hypothetical protein [bacterium]
MNRNLLIFTRGTSLVAGLLLAANGLAQAPAPAPVAPAAPVAAADDSTAPPTVDLNSPLPGEIRFHGAPVQAVLEYYADLTKRSIIAAPNLA